MMGVLRYSVIRYVPDPRREECINIGVIVVADDGTFVEAAFTTNWQRVQCFGQEDLSFLKEFARLLRYRIQQHQDSLFSSALLGTAALTGMAEGWHNSIQFTPPRASIAPDPRRLLEQLFSTYILEERPARRKARTKQEIVSLAQHRFQEEIDRKFKQDIPRVTRGGFLMGTAVPHELDLVIRNGRPLMGIEGVSFHRVPSEDVQTMVQSMGFVIEDVKRANSDLLMAVVVIPPAAPRADYTRALRIYEQVGAEVVEESGLQTWIDRTVAEFSRQLVRPPMQDALL